jgi:hypothetical protein
MTTPTLSVNYCMYCTVLYNTMRLRMQIKWNAVAVYIMLVPTTVEFGSKARLTRHSCFFLERSIMIRDLIVRDHDRSELGLRKYSNSRGSIAY